MTSPKERLVVEKAMSGAAEGAAAAPVPERDTVTDPSSGSLLWIKRVPDRAPVPVGVQVTVTVVLLPAPTVKEDGDRVNSSLLDEMLVTVRSALPVLDTLKD